nr:hypothetical protein GCM10020063_048440 [Dactylosporangium thailandense]
MGDLDRQREYWDTTGTTKTFGHPFDPAWLAGLAPTARILDYGCGYGRLTGELAGHGWTGVEGVDVAPQLLARARAAHPAARFTVLDEPPRLPHAAAAFDAALLFAVLTCIPTDEGQRALLAELHRVLAPGALLYVSDMGLQDDERNRARYERFAAVHGTYGVFETGDGAVVRHHTDAWFADLFAAFDPVDSREIPVRTMNGNPVNARQFLLRRA